MSSDNDPLNWQTVLNVKIHIEIVLHVDMSSQDVVSSKPMVPFRAATATMQRRAMQDPKRL